MASPDLTEEQQQAIDRMYDQVEEQDLYGLLAVDPNADANEIQAAYYALSRNWHPDRFFRKDLGEYAERLEIVFVSITQAYKTLTDPLKRKQFDREDRARKLRQAEERQQEERKEAAARRRAEGGSERSSRRGGESVRERLARNAQNRSPASRAVGRRLRQRMEAEVRGRLTEQLRKAKTFYDAGKADFEAGRVMKAAGALELAVQFDPRNEEYRELLEVAKAQARQARIAQLILQGEQAESYQQVKQAIHSYRQAVELGPSDGKVYHRLAHLVRHDESDDREALALFREAVRRSPEIVEYRMSLADLYRELGLRLNARREYQTVLEQDKAHAAAKAALKEL